MVRKSAIRVCAGFALMKGLEVPQEQSLNAEECLVDPGEAYFSNLME